VCDVKERDAMCSKRNGHITASRGKHKGESLGSAFLFHIILSLVICGWVPCVWSEVCIVTRLRAGRPRNLGSISARGIKLPCMKITSQIHPAPRLRMNGASFPLSHAPCMTCAWSNLASLYSMFHKWYTYISSLALCYKPEGRGFDSRWSHWDFSLI
jgi:hypothetical protein